MFRRIDKDNDAGAVRFTFDGTTIEAADGENLAAALLAAGIKSLRTTAVSGQERAPFCMMGACYDCLVRIDGESVQACMVGVADGLVVERIEGRGEGRDEDS